MYKLLAWCRAGAPHAWSSINLIGYIPVRSANSVLIKEGNFNDKSYEINSWREMINCMNDSHIVQCIANIFLLTKSVNSLVLAAYVLFFLWAIWTIWTIWQRYRNDLVWESLLTIGKERTGFKMTKITNSRTPQKPHKCELVKSCNKKRKKWQ